MRVLPVRLATHPRQGHPNQEGSSIVCLRRGQSEYRPFWNITIRQKLDSEVEVIAVLALGEIVVSNPSDIVQEGEVVDVTRRDAK